MLSVALQSVHYSTLKDKCVSNQMLLKLTKLFKLQLTHSISFNLSQSLALSI